MAAMLLGLLLGHYGAPKCPECLPTVVVPPPVVPLPEEKKPSSGEHLVVEAVNELFHKWCPREKGVPWNGHHICEKQPGESEALNAWHQANMDWIECLPPITAKWCSSERSMSAYEAWALEHPRPQ